MMTIGAIGFLQPWVLAALAALPAIWWLLRLTPPTPQLVVFPPTRLLKDLKTTEETPAHSPWWLTALRMLLAALLILALARPVLNPERQSFAGSGPLLLVIDNGWASAAHWAERREAIEAAIDRAARDGRTIVLAPTAPGQPVSDLLSPDQARERVGGLTPEPYAPDRAALVATLEKDFGGKTDYSVLWLSDGLDYGDEQSFAASLVKLAGATGSLAVLRPGKRRRRARSRTRRRRGRRASRPCPVRRRRPALGRGQGVYRPRRAPRRSDLCDRRDRARSHRPFRPTARDPQSGGSHRNRWRAIGRRRPSPGCPLAMASRRHRFRRVARGRPTPAIASLLCRSARFRLTPTSIAPNEGNVANAIHELIEQKVSTIVLADIGKLVAGTQEELEAWLKSGGVLIRFAGPRLEQGGDELLPVALRRGGRSLGGSLSWSTPQPLAPFEEKSPFRGLTVPDDVKVNRQVLADPTVASDAEVWATLADGTPLVTASKQGEGFIVLFHVTANSDWSNLPLSGLFVEMLRRIVTLGPSRVGTESGKDAAAVEASSVAQPNVSSGALPPLQTLDGFGQLIPPPLRATPIAPDKLDSTAPGPDHPPGYYGPSGAARAFNLITAQTVLKPLGTIEGSSAVSGYVMKKPVALEPWLYLAAIGLFVADIIAMLVLSGGLRFRRRAVAASVVVLVAAALLSSTRPSQAQDAAPNEAAAPNEVATPDAASGPDDFALKASLRTHLAYVLTGDPDIDRTSEEGLSGLSKVLRARTALEPAEPMGVDIDKDELSFFPILYWPVRDDAEPLSDATLAKIDAFMKQGGLIVFDTRDHETGFGNNGMQSKGLTRLIGQLDIPPLEPVPENHVLTKSFYLMRSFPGRWDGGQLWVEAEPVDETERSERSRRTDGVSSIVITSNDFASAWALDESNRPIYPTVPGGEVQREMAFRAGVNIVMYALTGNYKADQVHVPALLERLGQ